MYVSRVLRHTSGIIVFLLLFCGMIICGIYHVSGKFGKIEKCICFGFCGILIILCIAETVRYIVRLSKLRKSFDDDFDVLIVNCREHCSAMHYFLNDCLVTFQIPIRIFYYDIAYVTIDKCRSRYTDNIYYLIIELKNKQKIKLQFDSSEEYKAANILKRHNPNIIINEMPQ